MQEKNKQKKKYANKLRVLLKLEKLRLARHELTSKQYGTNQPPPFLLSDLIKEAHQQWFAEKQAMQKAKSREQQKQLETFTKNIEAADELKDEIDESNPDAQSEETKQDPKLEVLRFYYQAYESIDKLINIRYIPLKLSHTCRQNWDSYIVAPNTGTRIPQV